MKNSLRKTLGFLGVTLMATQLFGAPGAGSLPVQYSSSAFEQAASVTPVQKEIDRLLKEVSGNAATVARHAENLESFSRGAPRLQYETHAAELTRTKEAINAMGADFRQLQERRASALPWQQQLIDRIEPDLTGMAGSATDAIERLNTDRRGLPSEQYRTAIVNLSAYAGHARNVLEVNFDYAEARERLNRLDAPKAAPAIQADSTKPAAKPVKSLQQRVQSELLKLPYYGVFDHLAFQVNGGAVTLSGDVSWPTLKADAERAVRGVEGVAVVNNNIKVLPLSPNDNRIRIAAYRAIYGHSALALYGLNPHPPIRIIVENGNITLKGVVASEMDRTIANIQANRVPGAFSVTNDLRIGS